MVQKLEKTLDRLLRNFIQFKDFLGVLYLEYL